MRLRGVILGFGAACALVAGVEVIATHALNSNDVTSTTTGVAAIGGPFELVDDKGAPVTQASLQGKPSVIYFGYTYCPEACPTTLSDLTRWIGQLGPLADRMNYVFVSIDPTRDTPKVMKEYLQSFDHRIQGFTGSESGVAKMAKEYKVYYKKVPNQGGYLMDHSSIIYLMDATGRFMGVLPYPDKDSDAVAKLKSLATASS